MISHSQKGSAFSRFVFSRAPSFVFAAVLSSGGTALAASPHSAPSENLVRTQSGPVVGTQVENMRAFLGIPYAAPPVGALRWRPPHPHASWNTPLSATSFAPHCAQGKEFFADFGIPTTTEDCLYLNVFTPLNTRAGARLPVMFYIHGGALLTGESNDYDPRRLVDRGVVVVTINYRLGYLGFFAQSGLDAEDHLRANYGLMDQQSALAWSQRNIAAFGGDPARTTIFGESAGGLSVLSNLASPLAKGLFQGAIVESGGYTGISVPTLATAESQGNAVAAALGCATPACLRSVSVEKILALGPPAAGISDPAVDGTLLPLDIKTALATGRFNRVPVIDGANLNEVRLQVALNFDLVSGPIKASQYPTLVAGLFGAEAPAVLAAYPLSAYPSADLAFAALQTSAVFDCPAYRADTSLARYVPTFAYEFADEQAPEPFLPPVSFPYGAAHASELQFLFTHSTGFSRPSPPLSTAEHKLADTMARDWTNFAKAQAPWPRFSVENQTFERFVAPEPYLFSSYAEEHHCALFDAIAAAAKT